MNDIELMKKALATWGTESQLDMVVEECAELINAVQKWRRRRVDLVGVRDVKDDVSLCVEQLKLMLDAPVLWENIRKDKLERLAKLLGV